MLSRIYLFVCFVFIIGTPTHFTYFKHSLNLNNICYKTDKRCHQVQNILLNILKGANNSGAPGSDLLYCVCVCEATSLQLCVFVSADVALREQIRNTPTSCSTTPAATVSVFTQNL